MLWYRNAYNQIASDVWETNLQTVLINVLIIAIFEH